MLRPRLRITEEEWRAISAAASKVADAVDELEGIMTQVAFKNAPSSEDGTPSHHEANIMFDLMHQFTEPSMFRFMAYYTIPQGEWTGGDSSDPKNHDCREPHCVNHFLNSLPAKE